MQQGTLCIERPGIGDAMLTLEVYEEAGVLVCGVYELKGRITLPPKAWVRLVRAELRTIEAEATKAGCAEVRMAGRNWSRVFPDYERLDGPHPNILRKRLTNGA